MKIFPKITLVAVSIFLMAFACGEKKSPNLSKTVSMNSLVDLTTQLKDDNTISNEELSFFLSGISNLQADKIEGKTVSQVIEMQRNTQNNQLKNNLVYKANQRVLNSSLAFGVPKKNAIVNLTNKEQTKYVQHRLNLTFKNNRDKDIKSFIGKVKVTWTDKGKKKAAESRFQWGELKSGEQKNLQKAINVNTKSAFTYALLAKGGRTVDFTPEKIEFADGEVVSILPAQKK